MLKTFVPQFTKPERGNPYFNTISNGGYSSAIVGNPTDPDCNVYGNCVGHAYGRFNQIGNNKKMTYLAPRNAECFYDIALAQGLTVEQKPSIGACMVWQKGATRDPQGSDGAGHVAIVEQVISENEVITSESGYGCTPSWWKQTRKKGNGNWGAGGDYKFLGFIKHPDVGPETKFDPNGGSAETPVQPYMMSLTAGTPIYAINGMVVSQISEITVSTKYTIVDETVVYDKKYGKLKSGAGWVILETITPTTTPGTIKKGSTGDDVKKLQTKLVELGYMQKGCVDGVFGKLTLSGVCGYQLEAGLLVDGVVGPATWNSLNIVV